MERRVRRAGSAKRVYYVEHKRSLPQGNGAQSFASSYFTIKSILLFLWFAALLLILPLILPPLSPPPFLLLLIPIGLLVLLMVLAFMPSDAQSIASSSCKESNVPCHRRKI